MMSIRLRLTLLYTAILALTLIFFGVILYTIQARYTLDSIKSDLVRSSDNIVQMIRFRYLHPLQVERQPQRPPPTPLEELTTEGTFNRLREREIVRVLGPDGGLLALPFGVEEVALPLSAEGLRAVQNQQMVWEIATSSEGRLLISNQAGVLDGEVVFIAQVARPLLERDRSLASLESTLLIVGVLTTLAAFGIGWVFAGYTLRPIHRITQTAQEIGSERDFTRRVDYHGPNDEIGDLAKTFNGMLASLQEAYLRVSQALSLQRDFVADVSHELRTPLTTVRGNLALLRRQPPLPAEEQADVLTDLVDESDRLIRLVNDLLVLARADAGRGLVQEELAVRPLVEEVCRQARQLDPMRTISETIADITVLGDRDALKQALLILLDNAIKHTHGAIQVSSETGQSEAAICVRDEGPGMTPEMLEHVFDRFYRGEAEEQTQTNGPGFGLGLPIARALMEGMGGRITIESDAKRGSVVRIWLRKV